MRRKPTYRGHRMKRLISSIILASTLVACGGGGSGDNDSLKDEIAKALEANRASLVNIDAGSVYNKKIKYTGLDVKDEEKEVCTSEVLEKSTVVESKDGLVVLNEVTIDETNLKTICAGQLKANSIAREVDLNKQIDGVIEQINSLEDEKFELKKISDKKFAAYYKNELVVTLDLSKDALSMLTLKGESLVSIGTSGGTRVSYRQQQNGSTTVNTLAYKKVSSSDNQVCYLLNTAKSSTCLKVKRLKESTKSLKVQSDPWIQDI